MLNAFNLRQELASGLAGQNIDLVPIFDCLASGQPEVGEDQVQSVLRYRVNVGCLCFLEETCQSFVVSIGGKSWM